MKHSDPSTSPKHPIRARKRFGQNFLIDSTVIADIVNLLTPLPEQTLVEIGPGLGALTQEVLSRAKTLHAIEIDSNLIEGLHQKCDPLGQLILHQADALTFDFSQLAGPDKPLRIFGNLPYNISTPLIFHLLNTIDNIQDMLFMLQKEVVKRMSSAPGNKDFGRLSVMVQYYCQVQPLISIAPQSFKPKPKVTSQLVRLVPHQGHPHGSCNPDILSYVVRLAFAHRRKTLANNLKPELTAAELEALNINPKARAETLAISDFVSLSHAVAKK